MTTVEAGVPDVSPAVDRNIIADLPILDVPIEAPSEEASLPTELLDGGGIDTSEKTPSPTACQADASERLTCEPSKVEGIPWGPVVTVTGGTGVPSAPMGGTIVPGDYQLTSETVYGNVPPEVSVPSRSVCCS
jgi:hypothetical protein